MRVYEYHTLTLYKFKKEFLLLLIKSVQYESGSGEKKKERKKERTKEEYPRPR